MPSVNLERNGFQKTLSDLVPRFFNGINNNGGLTTFHTIYELIPIRTFFFLSIKMDLEYVDLKLEDLLEYIQKNNTNENHTYYYNKIVELKKDINEDKIDNDICIIKGIRSLFR